MGLTGTITTSHSLVLSSTLDLEAARTALSRSITVSVSDGTGVNQSNLLWTDSRTVASGVNDDLDLSGGLTSALGVAATFARVKDLLIQNTTASGGANLLIGGGSNPWITPFGASGDIIKLLPQGVLHLSCFTAAGYAVTASTGDILRIAHAANVSTSATYNIYIVGANA